LGGVGDGSGPNSSARGIMVLGDRLGHWTSARDIWNQQSYSATNVNDDGTIPKTTFWFAIIASGGRGLRTPAEFTNLASGIAVNQHSLPIVIS
jgi:hypothetical protein